MPPKYASLIRRLQFYPLILVVCWFWGTVNRLQNAFSPDNAVYWLYFLQGTFRSLQGLLNAVAYGTQPQVREAWAGWLSDRPRFGWLAEKVRPPMEEVGGGEGGGDEGDDHEEEGEDTVL